MEMAPCNNNRATCICGIAVRAGRSVFAIQLCDKQQPPKFLLCDDDDDVLDVRRRNANHYEVT